MHSNQNPNVRQHDHSHQNWPRLKDFESKDIVLLGPEVELEDFRSLPEPEEQDKDKVSLATEETDSAGPLTQSFAAYGFDLFKPRPEDQTRPFTSFLFPLPISSTSTIQPDDKKKMANNDIVITDGTKEAET